MQQLQGKVAIMTGGGRGIGRATAIALAKEGVHIGLIGRTLSNLENVASELENFGVKVAVAAGDVSKLEEATAAVEKIRTELGAIDILVNSAGIAKFGTFLELSPEEWLEIIQINVMGTYYITRAALPFMIEQQSGDIINIASSAGQKGAPLTSAYTASKAAVIGLSESLMLEVRKHNIRVSTLMPSTVATEMAAELKLTGDNTENVMQPEDLADFMISQLKLDPRIVIKTAGMWSTNP